VIILHQYLTTQLGKKITTALRVGLKKRYSVLRIAQIATTRDFQLSRYRANNIMKRLGLVSCQIPKHAYKRGGNEHAAIPNHLDRQFVVTEPNQAWCGDVTYGVPGVQH